MSCRSDIEYELKYLELLSRILKEGERRGDRTGTGTLSIFGAQLDMDISSSFPLLTTKRIFFRTVFHELMWFLSGETNVEYLNRNDIHIWDAWADNEGDLGPVYGFQWTRWPGEEGKPINQIENAIRLIRNNPESRRIVVSAWNVSMLRHMRLPPCHILFQFYVHGDGRLSCHMYQRSADMFIGVPYNIASYSLLTYMISHMCGLRPSRLVISFGDAHIYLNHIDQVKEQLSRSPKSPPVLKINPNRNITKITDYRIEDMILTGYDPHPFIRAPVAV